MIYTREEQDLTDRAAMSRSRRELSALESDLWGHDLFWLPNISADTLSDL